jgi:type III pantothenate kinase
MKLLLDIGNTRLKWALWSGGCFQERGHAPHHGQIDAVLAAIPKTPVAEIRFAQVLGADLGAALRAALRAQYPVPVREARVQQDFTGLRLAYAQPARFGVDRWPHGRTRAVPWWWPAPVRRSRSMPLRPMANTSAASSHPVMSPP